MIHIKRVYEEPAKSDGARILVDRLWPRGLTKQQAAVDQWLKELAPSTQLRQWFSHDPAKWEEFRKRYRKELLQQKTALSLLKQQAKHQAVTLVYGARDEEHNGAIVLKSFLEGRRR